MTLGEIAVRLEVLGNETRLAVFRHVVRAGERGLAVNDIHERTGVPRSTLSHHLRRLVDCGLMSRERRGTTLICRANAEAMTETLGFLLKECCADELDSPSGHRHISI